MANMNLHKSGKKFEKNDPRINRNGRPRKFISKLKETGYTQSEILDAIQVLISLNNEELRGIKNNQDSTVLEQTIASAILLSIQKGDLNTLETLLTRVYGKPKEKIEQDIKITSHVIKLKFGNIDEQEQDGAETTEG
jgi:hypothetical protein